MQKSFFKFSSYFCTALLLLLSPSFAGCKSFSSSLQKKYGADTNYFLGLKQLEEGNLDEAQKNFSICQKKGSPLCARYSLENLIKLQNQKKRIDMEDLYLEKYKDERALLFAAKDYFNSKEYSRIIYFTNDIDLNEDSNALIALRLRAMNEKKDSRLKDEVVTWFSNRKISTEHQKFATDFFIPYSINALESGEQGASVSQGTTETQRTQASTKTLESFSENFYTQTPLSHEEKLILGFRIAASKRMYLQCYESLPSVLEIIQNEKNFKPSRELCSDIGKTLIYGNKEYLKNAALAEKFAKGSSDQIFYFNFYAARLYDMAGDYFSKAQKCYKAAMSETSDPDLFDNALWYLLKLHIRKNSSEGARAIADYSKIWKDAEYYDDILDLISNLLLTEGKWNEFFKLTQSLDGFASDYTCARFSYISSRLIEEGLIDISSEKLSKSELTKKLYTRALSSGGDWYYRVSAISKLKLSEEETQKILCQTRRYDHPEASTSVPTFKNSPAETLLLGYADFGFPEKIYPEYLNLKEQGYHFSLDAAVKIATFLRECGKNFNEYYPQSLRLICKEVKSTDRDLTKEELKLIFPKDYEELIESAAERYSLKEELLYALIRGESFFDKNIVSSAKAVGLTQLMESTAGDVARKLKVQNYDLKDAQTNIEFGAFYIAELTRRLDGSQMAAILSYNTGITRIRRWLAQKKNLPMDLFLELAPYDETRGYGRKLTGDSAMYAWLHNGTSIPQTVFEMTK